MEPAKIQASKLFTWSPIDIRDKIEEVAEKIEVFCGIFTKFSMFYFLFLAISAGRF